jgi:hypothetical protein
VPRKIGAELIENFTKAEAFRIQPPDATTAATNKCLAQSNKSRTDIGRKAYRMPEKIAS